MWLRSKLHFLAAVQRPPATCACVRSRKYKMTLRRETLPSDTIGPGHRISYHFSRHSKPISEEGKVGVSKIFALS